MPLARSVAATRGRVDARRRSRSCRRPASAWPGRRRTASRSGRARPSRRGGSRGGARARDAPVQAAAVEHPADLLGEQEQRRDRRRVVGLVLERVLQRGLQREERRDPALGACERGDPLLRGRAQQREPQPAVGGEALLRREVVGVDLRRGPPAGHRRRRWRRSATSASPAPGGRTTGTITPVEVSLCAHAITSARPRSARADGAGSGASPGSAAITSGSSRNGAPAVTSANFWENSP